MSGCCGNEVLEQSHALRRSTLIVVLWINIAMFVVEFVAGFLADSTGLLADSADNLGDALTYGLSLYVLHRTLRWRSGAAMVKGLIQIAFGLGIAGTIAYKAVYGFEPLAPAMAAVAGLALVANLTCFALLMKHRGEDINMRSVWLCSRNDVIGNLGVLIAAGLVSVTNTFWPDVVVASILAALFIWTGIGVMRESLSAWRSEDVPPVAASSS